MERLARKEWANGRAADKRAPLFSKNKLRDLPPKESKPKAKFLATVGVKSSSPTGKVLEKNSFLRPSKAQGAAPPKIRAGFSLKTFSSKAKEVKKLSTTSTQKKPLSFAAAQPLKATFSAKKSLSLTSKEAAPAAKKLSFAPKAKEFRPLNIRECDQPPAAKRRKTTETPLLVNGQIGGKRKLDEGRQACATLVSPHSEGSNASKQPQKPRKGGLLLQLNDTLLKKRSLLAEQTMKAGPVPKKMKQQQLGWSRGTTDNRASESIAMQTEPAQDASPTVAVASTRSVSESFPSDRNVSEVVEECDGENGEDLAINVVCIEDEAKEQDFLDRAATIQQFTDRVAVERKHLHNRLLDNHADISESLLDAMMGLLAEEGGVGIDKLDVDMNIDIDAGELATVLEDCVI